LEERPDAARRKRPKDEDGQSATTVPHPEPSSANSSKTDMARSKLWWPITFGKHVSGVFSASGEERVYSRMV
jgi:hypothetical protein